MALAMPGPSIRSHTGVYHFNIRVPADLQARIKATKITLPFEEGHVTVVATDKVAFSLRTKDPAIARTRFIPAYASLARHFESVRCGPKPLTHRQIVALAGEIYRLWVDRYEKDATLTPAWLAEEVNRLDRVTEGWRAQTAEEGGPLLPESADWLPRLARPNGPELTAFELGSDIDRYGVSVKLAEAHEFLFGRDVDRLCAEKALTLDEATRLLLLSEVAQAVRYAAEKLIRGLGGDYGPDPAAARFPAYEPPAPPPARETRPADIETVGALFERWKSFATGKVAPSTIRRYGPTLASLDRWAAGRDWRSMTDTDFFAWATHRQEVDGIAPTTVNRNDLVAASSVFAWPTTYGGGKLTTTNPVSGVRLPTAKKKVKREKTFRKAEIRNILRAARAVEPDRRFPRASASRRWVPWVCAYSGARVQEVLWLEKRHIWREGDVWVMEFPQTKDGNARVVPIHAELEKEGLLEFIAAAPSGFLFVGDREQKANATRTAQELRAAELARWIRSTVDLDEGVSPNHAWRHTWITYAEAAGIPKRFSNRITGHNAGDVSDRYVTGLISLLAEEMNKFPAYKID